MTCWTLLILVQFQLLFHTCMSVNVINAYNGFGSMGVSQDKADEVDWRLHPCRRTCEEGIYMTCYYIFRVEGYTTMSKACYNCPYNITDCFRPHCIPGDGVKRSITVINRQLPGPSIEVCQGDRVIVDVMNLLHSESTTMHWHGQNQMDTPFMDGVPHVTQCPIAPGSTFQYDFLAMQAGTHFWHSHLGIQRGEGAFGPLIVRLPRKRDLYKKMYTVDNITLMINDWTHQTGYDMFLLHHHADGDNKPPSILINGLGRFQNFTMNNRTVNTPIETITVQQNVSYRVRIINAEFLNCPVEISIDNHSLSVISTDGRDIEVIRAETLVVYAGERYDVVLNANQKIGNYWMRFRGLMDCDERFTRAYQVAILRYQGAPEEDPRVFVSYERTRDRSLGVRVNALNEGTESNDTVSAPQYRARSPDCPANTRQPDYKFFISYDFYPKDNPVFHRKNLYGYNQVDPSVQLPTPQLNNITMRLPSFSLLTQRNMIGPNQFCNTSTVRNCKTNFCQCTHVLSVKLNSVVEVILVDEGVTFDANHPFHLHGFEFRVIAMERLGTNTTLERVKEMDARGQIKRNLFKAPVKDTVTVPDGGYTVIRFHAKNPGYWFFHCHIEFHAEIGMSLVFKVGEHEEMVPTPSNFPKCGNWEASGWQPMNNFMPTVRLGSEESSTDSEIVTTDNNSLVPLQDNESDERSSEFQEVIKLLPHVLKIFGVSSGNYIMSSLGPFSISVIIFALSIFG